MLRRTTARLLRMPKARRPRERPWEIFNTRDFGYHEGSQNYLMWGLASLVFGCLLLFETWQQSKRIFARGDTCAACEAARAHYRLRVEDKERELAAINSRSGSTSLARIN